jgi:hypothetical protein
VFLGVQATGVPPRQVSSSSIELEFPMAQRKSESNLKTIEFVMKFSITIAKCTRPHVGVFPDFPPRPQLFRDFLARNFNFIDEVAEALRKIQANA